MRRSKTENGLVVAAALAILSSTAIPAAFADGLTFDAEHDVFVFPKYELTVRYNNKTFAPVKAVRTDKDVHYLTRDPLASVKISEDFTNMSIAQTPENISIECYDSGNIGPLGTNRISKEFLKENHVREVSYPNDKIARETGLPVSALQSMKAVMVFEVKPKSGAEPYNLFVFQHDTQLTTFARRMRSGRADIKNDPPVIVVDMRVGEASAKDSKASVDLSAPPQTANDGTAGGGDAQTASENNGGGN